MSATQEFQRILTTRVSALFFFLGKLIRFVMSLVLLILLRNNTSLISGYTLDEVIIFFLTFNLIDIVAQMFFRGVYMVSGKIRSGELDGYLAKPINVLFRLLTGSPDINDFIISIPFFVFTLYFILQTLPALTIWSIALYMVFLFNGLVIALAFHIFVVCFGILTTEVDNTIMLYRDISQMGRFPVEIYREPLRAFITYIIPVGVMMNIPAKVLIHQPNIGMLILSIGISMSFLFISLKTWGRAMKQYTSASS